MPERTRAILSRLRKFIRDRRRAERFKVRLPLAVSLADERAIKGSREPPSLEGYTLDISTSGLGLMVPAIRLGERYLAGENRPLRIKLDLPAGAIEIQATPVRYERFDEDESEMVYLIGARITAMSDADRVRYNEYLAAHLKKSRVVKT
jgi:hypothetical protein